MSDSLRFGAVSLLHAIAAGNRFGVEIMQATGLTSGTAYPALDRLEQRGYLKSRGNPRPTPTARDPARRYFHLTAADATALEAALQKFKTLRPVRIDPSSLAPRKR
jgi:PadR family transcriptional regulator PadR